MEQQTANLELVEAGLNKMLKILPELQPEPVKTAVSATNSPNVIKGGKMSIKIDIFKQVLTHVRNKVVPRDRISSLH